MNHLSIDRQITSQMLTHTDSHEPTLLRMVSFFVRSNGLKVLRYAKDYGNPIGTPKREFDLFPHIISESITPLRYVRRESEKVFEEGKIRNLRLACGHINGLVMDPYQVFSFWKSIGAPWKSRGFVIGREIREGCLIPTIGGGLCQLSGSLYAVAQQARLSIVERHAHTSRIQDAHFDENRDATIFWNYVDLRFCGDFQFQIEAKTTENDLVVRLRAKNQVEISTKEAVENSRERTSSFDDLKDVSDCLSCGQFHCRQNQKTLRLQSQSRKYVLSDKLTPEFKTFLRGELNINDVILTPNRRRSGLAHYHQDFPTPVMLKEFPWATFKRSFVSRFGRRRKVAAWVRMAGAAVLSKSYMREIESMKDEHLYIDQELLPFLWKNKFLSGRQYTVMASRLPMAILQQRLDRQLKNHPERQTLNEFRLDKDFIDAENQALQGAQRIVSAHSEVAQIIPKCEEIGWVMPDLVNHPEQSHAPDLFLFPAITAAREGAFEVRRAARALNLRLAILENNLEGNDFWNGIKVERYTSVNIPWDRVAAVIHPACFTSSPRLHLEAVARGIPVIASAGCGISLDKITQVELDSSDDLILKINNLNKLENRNEK